MWGYPKVKYQSNNVPDLNANILKDKAKVKGDISTIPEVKGLIVQKSAKIGHVGIYLGNGYVLESTIDVFKSGEGNGLVITQFKDKNLKNYRGTWETWLEYPYITYKRGDDMNDRYLGTDIHTVKQGKNQFVQLLQYHKRIPLSSFIYMGKKPNAIINFSFFTSSYVVGSNQGDMFNDTVNDSKYGQFIDLVIYKNGEYVCKPRYSWEHTDIENIACGGTVATVLIRDGKPTEEYSKGIEIARSKFVVRDPQTAIAILKDKRVVFIKADGRNARNKGINGNELRDYVYTNYPDVELLCQLDGGGSSELIVNGKIIGNLSDGRERPMFNGLALFDENIEVEPTKDYADFYLNFSKSIYGGTYVRSSRSIKTRDNIIGFAKASDNERILVESCGFTESDSKGQWCKTLQEVKLSNGKVAPKGSYIRFDHEEKTYIE